MQPDEKNIAYIWDMLSACKEIQDFMENSDWEDFIGDRKLVLAIERSLEIIGEAASRISESFRKAQYDIPWSKIRGMRNILAHEYGHVDYEIVYETAVTEMPDLLVKLEKLLPQDIED